MSPREQPRFLICRCGEAFAREHHHSHECRPKAWRQQHVPELYNRWIDPRSRHETERELHRLGQDPAFAPGNEQRDFLK